MKMKSFAVLALSSLLAASVAPAMADDMSNSGSSMQAPTSDTGMPSNTPNSGSSMPTDTNPSNMGNVGSTDEGSPDTATGDDDY